VVNGASGLLGAGATGLTTASDFTQLTAREPHNPGALLSLLHYVVPRSIIRGQRTFQGLLNNSHLGLLCDEIWIASRISPIGRTRLPRRHLPAVA
jgi:hypothetical protein